MVGMLLSRKFTGEQSFVMGDASGIRSTGIRLLLCCNTIKIACHFNIFKVSTVGIAKCYQPICPQTCRQNVQSISLSLDLI